MASDCIYRSLLGSRLVWLPVARNFISAISVTNRDVGHDFRRGGYRFYDVR